MNKKSKKLFKSKNVNPKADDTILKDIVNAIETNEDLALYQEFIYRTDSEISVEIGAEHYMSINKWDIIKNEVIKNLRHHNAYVINFYTSETTGTPIIENVDLGDNAFMTMPFSREDAMDCTGFIHKQSITFGNFVRMFGASLTKEELVQIFDSTRGASQSYATSTPSQRETAKIRIGKCVWETQNIEVYKTGMNPDGNMIMVKKDDNYEPQKGNTKYQSDKKHFNVWYECFFIDYTGNSTQGSIDASRIFKYRKVQDQQRFGEDGRMSKSPYIIYSKNSIMPINEIITRFMKMINLIWFRVQNDIGNDNPHIQIYVAEALESIMNNIDTETSKHENSMGESIKMIKQTGKAIVNRFMKDNPNQIIDNPIKDVPSGYMNSAMEKLGVIGVLYELMLKSIGINDVSEGNSPKPRQALGGIEMATQASNNSRFYLEEAMMNCHVELLYRFLYYFHEIVNENDKERVAELESIVGEANSKALSGIKDIPLHSLGIHIDPTDIEELKRIVLEMAANEYKKGALPAQDYLFLISSTNIKKAIAILRLRLNQRERKLQEQQERQFQQQMQLQQSNLETQKQLMGVDGQIKAELEKVKGQVDERLLIVENKLQTQGSLEVSDKRKSNKLEEIQVQDQVDTKNKMIGVS